ncbi:RdgB/HAM1 family non-canonical purine NTP pyrophosphatase [Candidatus Pandoraea novymonadis]|uniref:dITP/XTP pyrophosphatase n=1 Tax=Candidatus Pandoraea novymonadis TaxID=1808959 RepID=A0ABX5FE37_9BURK|nr:RdgB/HAM1 family non-canonical purine NTP pyrophosphatase [Candidatus Pandoraea novymonadis]PSB91988.1 dITP/XTP pyrophosphatase [Candidatus Pandoraea novymonadis]
MTFKKIVLASNNDGKLREFATLLKPLGIQLIPQSVLGISESNESSITFIENAITKARHASSASGLPALAEDSGLCVPILGGAPGIYSSRYAARAGYAKSDTANNHYLIEQLSSYANQNDRRAYYFCALVLIFHAQDSQPLIAEGRWEGEIITQPRGLNGFGYDPHFLIPSLQKTAAELNPEVKNTYSHRGHAVKHLLHKLNREA